MKRWFFRKWIALYSRIVHEKATPEYIARGWAVGMFFGCLVPFGVQLIFSVPTAFLLKGSKIGATIGTLLTNHFTIFLIYPVQCYVGNKLLGGNLSYRAIEAAMSNVLKDRSWEALMRVGEDLIAAFFIGGALLTAIMTPITYYAVKSLVVHRRNKSKKQNSRGDNP